MAALGLTARTLLCTTLVAASSAVGVVTTVTLAGPANAAPCGAQGTGSSVLPTGSLGGPGSLGGLDTGSLGGSGESGRPNPGPQGPMPVYRSAHTRSVEWLTGPRSANNTLERFGISGTDLGISWDNGTGQTLMAFGDTFGDCDAPGLEWRYNVLFRTDDDDLADGITIPDAVPGDVSSGSVVTAARPDFSA